MTFASTGVSWENFPCVSVPSPLSFYKEVPHYIKDVTSWKRLCQWDVTGDLYTHPVMQRLKIWEVLTSSNSWEGPARVTRCYNTSETCVLLHSWLPQECYATHCKKCSPLNRNAFNLLVIISSVCFYDKCLLIQVKTNKHFVPSQLSHLW